ncbi:3-deoxy-7-phosphoheptulonate synthase [Paraburkholderia hospita]|uniref:Phospho-2-dehydro-3-deoxyheptonate aldolase n=1 Tax=Paraburkholderia hospita TaxID=169430 RepID=A0AAN1JAJ8_9BURK|nr:3-deoxy-7-phosphoheptulonate synthase [Paraburkholderia hospita]AUT70408.1 3-deoxy-7-phosphoheptulonate synthase [Paraburkholderia hospita]EIM99849.1 phospho-2-dehydro-3-deoxyheptonate aldolase [Paraburkholderia hospita]OUL85724.1 3-deoxy-7-phosphoheptulonate synthase [Paraburkholderia hospita]OUL88594.1 3-deoxy-7-phosphoheptulonate synthase [Paraburkholderia hospita]SEH53898.1 3-deoxy-D-arabinoheptulosonate-7-phosphate synthase [Paraburkholderia hospita]
MSRIDNPTRDQEAGIADSTQDITRIDDTRIGAVRPLISPALLLDELPCPPGVQTLVEQSRVEIADILHDRDDRLVVVVGPCSIHDHDQAMEYAHKLKVAADSLRDDLMIVMRVYFEKPRTTVGWKGYINDPRLDGSFRINEGLRRARELLLEISGLGLPTGTEFLDLLSPQYIADLIAWGAIGARTTESQSHRQLASGLSCPIGFKNGTDGGVQIAADAIVAAAASHAFMGMTKMGMAAIFETRGNDDAHVILRGGKKGPNYDAAGVEEACAALRKLGLREQVMVDCSHANSNKSHERQIEVAQDLANQLTDGDKRIVGVMIESHLEAGRQDLKPGVPLARGVSITDACIGWAQTEPVLHTLAQAVRARRQAVAGK